MAFEQSIEVLTDVAWEVLHPLIEECRPRGKTQHHALRRTIEAIIWYRESGAKWRSIPPELGPWWMAGQTFIRWARLGVWERLLGLAQECGVALGMVFLDGTSSRAHPKVAGYPQDDTSRNALARNALARNALARNALARNALARNALVRVPPTSPCMPPRKAAATVCVLPAWWWCGR